jgi:hypothetical protein
MSNRLNRAVTADAVGSDDDDDDDDDDDMMKMLIVSYNNRQNGHTLEDNNLQKKNTKFHLPTAISNQNQKVSYAVK